MISNRPSHLLIVALGVGIATAADAPAGAQALTESLKEVGITPHIGESIPRDLLFCNTNGRRVALSEFLGDKPIVLTPVYYRCPMLCGLELNGLIRCLRALDLTVGEDFDIVTFSIDPREGPELAAEKHRNYLAEYGRAAAENGWQFLTGDAESIAQLCQSIGFGSQFHEETGQYAHAAGIVILTPEGQISRYLYGVEFAPRDLKLALVEASAGKLGSVTDQVLLYCYMYDPTTGKYGLAILSAVRAAGVMTVLLIVSGVSTLLWRERCALRRSPACASHAARLPGGDAPSGEGR